MTRLLHDIGCILAIGVITMSCVALAGSVRPAQASDDIRLALPIDCTLGSDCWIVNYVDLDSSSDIRDFFCGSHSYDGHKGTDFAIRSLSHMGQGVSVLASARGVVTGIRDGMPDISVALVGRDSLGGRECGNGMVIKHGGGWETQYCHLRQGSVAVKKGDVVDAGTYLGDVGQSGMAEFPHVHISVRKDGEIVDPFTSAMPRAGGPDCTGGALKSDSGASLWLGDILEGAAPEPTAIMNFGFAGVVPNAESIRSGLFDEMEVPPTAPVLALWLDVFWAAKGDRLALRITNPDGSSLVDHSVAQEKLQARRWVFAGKKLKQNRWPAGTYIGEVTIHRTDSNGKLQTFQKSRKLVVP